MVLAFVGAFVMVVPFTSLARRFPTQRLPEYARQLLGPWLGWLIQFLLTLFLIGSFLLAAITIELHVNDYLMTETPTIVFVVGISLLSLYGAYLGLEVLARLSLWGLGFSLLLGSLMVIGSVDHFDVTRLMPAWEHGLPRILQASSVAWTDTAQLLVGLIYLWPRSTGDTSRWRNLSWLGVLLGAVTVLVWPVFEMGALGPEVTAQFLISCMQLARAAELGIYLPRYEMIMMVLFGWAALIQAMGFLYMSLESLQELFPTKRLSRGWFMTLVTFALLPGHYWLSQDREILDRVHTHLWPVIALPIALGLPLLLLLVAMVRRSAPTSLPSSGA